MPFTVPTLSTWRAQVRQYFAARLGTNSTLRVSAANILADGLAGVAHGVLRYFVNISRELFLATMDGAYLDRRGAIYNMPRLGATSAGGNMTFSGTNGIPVPIYSMLLAQDGVTQISVQAAGTISGGAVTLPVLASPGSAGNLAAGASAQFVVAIPGINPGGVVATGGLTGGTDIEMDEAYSIRVLARQVYPPHGGAWFDYVAWAKQVAGVTRVWIYPQGAGAGTVVVNFVMDARANPIPLSGDLSAVAANIANYVPACATVTVPAPVANPIAVNVHNLAPSNATVQAAIAASLQELFTRVSTPGGASYGDGLDGVRTAGHIDLSEIYGAIQNATGVEYFDLTAPTTDLVQSSGTIATLGALTWV